MSPRWVSIVNCSSVCQLRQIELLLLATLIMRKSVHPQVLPVMHATEHGPHARKLPSEAGKRKKKKTINQSLNVEGSIYLSICLGLLPLSTTGPTYHSDV